MNTQNIYRYIGYVYNTEILCLNYSFKIIKSNKENK